MERNNMLMALIGHYANGSKAKFARLLGVTPQAISTWLNRNVFDIELIYAKCEHVNADWLLSGEGSMLREDDKPTTTKQIEKNTTQATQVQSGGDDTSLLYRLYKESQSESKQLLIDNCRKDELINQLQSENSQLQADISSRDERIWQLEEELEGKSARASLPSLLVGEAKTATISTAKSTKKPITKGIAPIPSPARKTE